MTEPTFANHGGGWRDAERYRANVEAGATLCDRCEGTGNELFSMYRRCPDCGGSGVATQKEER